MHEVPITCMQFGFFGCPAGTKSTKSQLNYWFHEARQLFSLKSAAPTLIILQINELHMAALDSL